MHGNESYIRISFHNTLSFKIQIAQFILSSAPSCICLIHTSARNSFTVTILYQDAKCLYSTVELHANTHTLNTPTQTHSSPCKWVKLPCQYWTVMARVRLRGRFFYVLRQTQLIFHQAWIHRPHWTYANSSVCVYVRKCVCVRSHVWMWVHIQLIFQIVSNPKPVLLLI